MGDTDTLKVANQKPPTNIQYGTIGGLAHKTKEATQPADSISAKAAIELTQIMYKLYSANKAQIAEAPKGKDLAKEVNSYVNKH